MPRKLKRRIVTDYAAAGLLRAALLDNVSRKKSFPYKVSDLQPNDVIKLNYGGKSRDALVTSITVYPIKDNPERLVTINLYVEVSEDDAEIVTLHCLNAQSSTNTNARK